MTTARPLDIDTLHLASGGHVSPDDDMCLLEAAAYMSGEPLDVALNAELVARLKPLQKAGYGVFRQQRGKRLREESHGPVLFTPLIPHEEHGTYGRLAEVLIMPIRPPDEAPEPPAAS